MSLLGLPTQVEGGGHRGFALTCTDSAGAVDLTGATGVTGKIVDRASTARAIAGTLTVSDPANGVVTWAFAAGDLVAGAYLVQITISYALGLPERTFATPWQVERGY
jgi:hypothetical protein